MAYFGKGRTEAVRVEPLDRSGRHVGRGVHEEAESFAQTRMSVEHRLVADHHAAERAEQIKRVVVDPATSPQMVSCMLPRFFIQGGDCGTYSLGRPLT